MTSLRELADRAESSTGEDRVLDGWVEIALSGWSSASVVHLIDGDRPFEPSGKTVVLRPTIANHMVTRTPRNFSTSADTAKSILPWGPHPTALLRTKLTNDGSRGFYCFVEFCWPSTEIQGRARDEARATLACALRAIQRTNEELAPYQKTGKAKP